MNTRSRQMVPPRSVGVGSLPRSHARIWRTVASIPPGTVASYGQVAREAGLARRARLVGQALRRLPPGLDLPWHRVVSATGRISLPGEAGRIQALLLLEEGIRLVRGRVDLRIYRWTPRRRQRGGAAQAAHRRS